MALFILFCDVTAELTNQELRFGLKIPLVVIANGAQNSNLSKIFGSLLFSYRTGPLNISIAPIYRSGTLDTLKLNLRV